MKARLECMKRPFQNSSVTGGNVAADYDAIDLPATRQAFGPVLDSVGDLRGRHVLEVAFGTGHLQLRPSSWRNRCRSRCAGHGRAGTPACTASQLSRR